VWQSSSIFEHLVKPSRAGGNACPTCVAAKLVPMARRFSH
jgi:hypothetical protein